MCLVHLPACYAPATSPLKARPALSLPWLQEWSYLRGGLTALDRDYGIFNKIHHDIGTHVVHHLFPQASAGLGLVPVSVGGPRWW